MTISEVCLEEKSGGRSGHYLRSRDHYVAGQVNTDV